MIKHQIFYICNLYYIIILVLSNKLHKKNILYYFMNIVYILIPHYYKTNLTFSSINWNNVLVFYKEDDAKFYARIKHFKGYFIT